MFLSPVYALQSVQFVFCVVFFFFLVDQWQKIPVVGADFLLRIYTAPENKYLLTMTFDFHFSLFSPRLLIFNTFSTSLGPHG